MNFSADFWHNHFRSTLFVELEGVVKVLESRILPQFSNISAEATDIRNKIWNDFASSPSNGDDDPSGFFEAAFEAGYAHYSLMSGLSQGVVNLFAASLFHIHEQHLMVFYKRQLHDLRKQLDLRWLKPSNVITYLGELGVNAKGLPSWKSLKEIELLANAIKHGEGEAAQALRKKRPEFFIDPAMSSDMEFSSPLHLDKPLLGDGIYVSIDHLEGIEKTIVAFWNELFEALKQHEHNS